jgi:hypothetical protein
MRPLDTSESRPLEDEFFRELAGGSLADGEPRRHRAAGRSRPSPCRPLEVEVR